MKIGITERGDAGLDLSWRNKLKTVNGTILINSIIDNEYVEIITLLDYELRVNNLLSELVFPVETFKKKIIVDLALKSGVDEYRFVSFEVGAEGKIILGTNRYIEVSKDIERMANIFLQKQSDIVLNSFLTDKEKNEILCKGCIDLNKGGFKL